MSGSSQRPYACYAARSPDAAILEQSSSGGAFTELAKVVIAQGGSVVGASWADGCGRVMHKSVDSVEDLVLLRGSKYLRSDLGAAYSEVEAALAKGRSVLFVGTPCQTAAMRKKFFADAKLFLCAIMCQGVPEDGVWDAYLNSLMRRYDCKVTSVAFRDKEKGWNSPRFKICFDQSERNISLGFYGSLYGHVFTSGLAVRVSCMNCQYKLDGSCADIMIGDFWGESGRPAEWNDNRGVSSVIVFTQDGEDLIRSSNLLIRSVEFHSIASGQPYLTESIRPDALKRQRFLSTYRRIGFARAVAFADDGYWYRRWPLHCFRKFRKVFREMCACV